MNRIPTKTQSLLTVFTVFLASAYLFWRKSILFLDPDFGWQLKTGEYILQQGFPKTDPFSYSMPSFEFVPHSWLSEIFIAQLFPMIGYSGLAAITSIITALALVVCVLPRKATKPSWLLLIPLILGASTMLPYISVRPQVFSWLFFAIFLVIVFEKSLWKKYAWTLPLVMIIWVNMHGGFALGIGLLGFHTLYELINSKKLPRKHLTILSLTLAATFVNPYFHNIWREVFATFFDNKLRTEISEWKPLYLRMSEFYIPLMAISLAFTAKTFKKVPRDLVIFFFLLLFVAFGGSKLFPFWIITAVYITPLTFDAFEHLLRDSIAKKRYLFVMKLVLILAISTTLLHIPRIWKSYHYFSEENFYSRDAVDFVAQNIQTRDPHENIFTPFIWGGYTLWHIPNKKVFIDGRMTYWTNFDAPENESKDAFVEQGGLIALRRDTEEIIKKYNIATILLPKTSLDPSFKKFATYLDEDPTWTKIYENDNALVYQKP